MDAVNVRNLEQIREHDSRRAKSRLGTLILASLGGAGVVVAVVVTAGHSGHGTAQRTDALSALGSQQSTSGPAARVDRQNVSFPSLLSDAEKPTTALAAVKDEHGRLVVNEPAAEPAPEPAAAADRIPQRSLPAAELLNGANQAAQAKDPLAKLAIAASQVPDNAELASEGHDGGIQIQVASFRSIEDAEALVKDLRHKGHHAFRQAAYVPDRGLWQRVRIGPFKSRLEATAYRRKLEQTERILAFVIDPDKKKRPAADRESVLSNRDKPNTPSAGL
jgi:cell division septation protein DedD